MRQTIIISALLIFAIKCYSQDFAGSYYYADESKYSKWGSSLILNSDSSFVYKSGGGIMRDEAVGTAVINKNIITLFYTTLDYTASSFRDTIDSGISSVPYLSTKSVIFEQKLPIPGSAFRPIVLKKKRKSLIVLEYNEANDDSQTRKKVIYKNSRKDLNASRNTK